MPGDKVRWAVLRVARILVDPPPVAGMRLRLEASAGVLITSTLVSNVAVLFLGEYWGDRPVRIAEIVVSRGIDERQVIGTADATPVQSWM